MTEQLSWTPPEGGKITFPPGTTPEQVREFIAAYKPETRIRRINS